MITGFRHFFSLAFLLLPPAGMASTYFEMDFENGQPAVQTPHPVWSLPKLFANNYGENNFFHITDEVAHRGRHSLRFDYSARNGYCNTCGFYRTTHKRGLDDVDYFVADDGKDLASKQDERKKPGKKKPRKLARPKPEKHPGKQKKHRQKSHGAIDKGPAASPGKILYNRDNGYSKWQITAVGDEDGKNDRLELRLLAPGIGAEKPAFHGGDRIVIARQCDVDGHIGRKVGRRSDCNNVITWFAGVTEQRPGQSLFRRMYLMVDDIDGDIHQKLHYFRAGGRRGRNIVLYADSRHSDAIEPQVSGLKAFGGEAIYRPGKNGLPAGIHFEPGVWYYLEEEYRAATLDDSGRKFRHDGVYRLWIAADNGKGIDAGPPVLTVTGLDLPPIAGGRGQHISFWGNIQHDSDTRGYWYMDDIKIADRRIGPD